MHNAPPQQLTIEQALQQAVSHQRSGHLQAAADLYRAILQAQPGQPDANQNMGILSVQSGQLTASLQYFKAALENRPSAAQHWLSYIEALILNQQMDAARRVIEQGRQHGLQGEVLEALADRANPERAPLDTAITQREAGDYPAAIATLRTWLDKHSDDAEAHSLLAQLLLLNKQNDEASGALDVALALNPKSAVVQRNYARLLLRQQRVEAAVQAAQLAYQANTADPESQAMLAATLIAIGELEPASSLLANALQQRPRYAEALANRAQLKLRLGDLPAALADIRLALEIKPHMAQFWMLAISLLSRLGDNASLGVALERYLALEPDDVPRILSLGVVKRLENKTAEAITLFRRATALAPDNAPAWSNLAMALHEQKQTEEAKSAYQQALRIDTGMADVNHNLGALALAEGRHADARRHFEAAIAARPELGASYLNLGHTLTDLNEMQAAMEAYGRASELNSADGSGHGAALSMALLNYIRGDLDQCAERLVAARPIMNTPATADNSDRVYWSYLATLLSWHQQNPGAAAPVGDAETLYVVGESHALATHRMKLHHQGQTMQCLAQWVPGAKQWHLGSGRNFRATNCFELKFKRLPPGSKVLLCIGEIDCRHDEGILVAWKKNPAKSLQAMIEATINGYIARLTGMQSSGAHRLVVCGVPASNANLSHLPLDEEQQFVQLIRDFNRYLRQQVLAANMSFLDVHALTDRGDGHSNGQWHLDPIHLLPSAISAAFERHLIAS